MPPTISLNLQEYLRYFFSTFIIAAYFCIYGADSSNDFLNNFKCNAKFLNEIGAIPAITFIVTGPIIYFVYRHTFYELFILPAYDFFYRIRGLNNYRNYIIKRYGLNSKTHRIARFCGIISSYKAHKVKWALSEFKEYNDAMEKRNRPVRAGAIHLLYQASLFAVIFGALSWVYGHSFSRWIFFSMAFIEAFTAIVGDINFEDEEFILIQKHVDDLDKAAKSLGHDPVCQI